MSATPLPCSSETVDAVVAGAGPAGLVAALALAHHRLNVSLVSPVAPAGRASPDTRTTALFGGSIELLHHLCAWPALEPVAAPLAGLRVIDDTGGLLRAPETLFRATELDLDCFGYNVANADLTRVLEALAADAAARIQRVPASVSALRADDRGVEVALAADAPPLRCRLVVGADGRESVCRAAAGIGVTRWSYPQAALAARFGHSRPHANVSTEFHRRAGPLTTVPLPGRQSSLVWVDTPAEIERLRSLADDAFARELENRLQGLLGTVDSVGPRAAFPLSGLSVEAMARRRVALVGEAAHVIPPIGAQGLNLGFRDAAWIAEIAGAANARGEDIGSAAVLEVYERSRRADVATRTLAVDILNRSLTADLLPLDLVRGAGLVALDALPWLRRLVMREGIAPSAAPLPALLRPTGIVRQS